VSEDFKKFQIRGVFLTLPTRKKPNYYFTEVQFNIQGQFIECSLSCLCYIIVKLFGSCKTWPAEVTYEVIMLKNAEIYTHDSCASISREIFHVHLWMAALVRGCIEASSLIH